MKRLAFALGVVAVTAAPFTLASSLIDSIRAGNQALALELVKDGADVNEPEANGTTPLHWAVHGGDLALVNQLIKAGANVNAKNNYGASVMVEAALLGNAELLAALLDAGADPESPNADGQTALMVVARSNNVAAAQLLLQHGANINATEQWQGQNAVIWAAAQSQPQMLELLLQAGGDANSRSIPNERDRQISAERRFQWRPAGGFTALAYAAREGCLDCTRLLVEAGADIDTGDVENVTPLNLAIMNFHFDTAKYLIEAGANVDKWSFRGENPVYSAVDMNTVPHGGYPDRPSTDTTTALDILQLLLEKGANPNLQLKLQPTYRQLKDDRGADGMLNIGATPLLRAAKAFDVAAMQLLLQHGALPNLPNRNGTTPTMAASGLGSNSIDTRGDYVTPLAGQHSRDALAVMLANGGDLNARDNNGRTALHGAASWGWNEAVEFIAASGVDLQAKDNNGLSPLDVALGKTAGAGAGRGGGGNPHPETAALLQKLLLEREGR